MASPIKHPASETPFLNVRLRDLSLDPSLRGVCVGYEAGRWRKTELARHVIEWLPEFALDYSEREAIGHHNCVRLTARAALSVYTSDKYKLRGEFGEILLHILLRQDCESTPAISKLFFKSSTNDTVKGFDAVHVVGPVGDLELWLGEVKFYSDVGAAMREVVDELIAHTQHDYLRREFLWIGNKLDPKASHATEIQLLMDRNVSLDKIFKRLCFPVLLTYDSDCVAKHKADSAEYQRQFDSEVRHHYATLVGKGLPPEIRIHVMLLPLLSKSALVAELDERLKSWQKM